MAKQSDQLSALASCVVAAHLNERKARQAAVVAKGQLRDAVRSLTTAVYHSDSFEGPGLTFDSTSFVVDRCTVVLDLNFNETNRDILESVRVSSNFPG